MKKIFILLSILSIGCLTACSFGNNDELDNNDELEENLYKADETYLGINLAGVSDYSSEYPFKDIFKMARAWRTDSNKDAVFKTDENGWITDLNGNDHAIAYLVNKYLPIGEYALTYEGSGSLELKVQSNITITSKEDGRIEFTVNSYAADNSNHWVRINSIDEDNYIKNIKIFETKFEDNLDDMFHPDFIDNYSMFHDFRFMDFMDTNNSEISEWNDRPKVNDYSYSVKGVPVEVMVALCNKVKANPWFCMPHSATDEYVEEFAKYVKDNLDSNLTVYLENSNETWNGIFSAQAYNLEQGKLHSNIGEDKGYADWKIAAHYYAQRSVEMFIIWEEFYGTDNLIKVLASQSSNYGVGTTIMGYELEDGSIAADYANALAIAPYIGNNCETTNQTEIFAYLEEELEGFTTDILANKEKADLYNLDLICYEAGQHLENSNTDLTSAFIEANRSSEMGDLYTKYLDLWKSTIGSKMFLFSSTGIPGSHGSWGLLEYQGQNKNEAYKYFAVVEWLEKNPWIR